MLRKIALILLPVSLLTGCKKELQPQDSSPVSDSTAVAAMSAAPQPQMASAPAQQATMMPIPQPVQQQVKTAKGMNPPHGQPGHRCDIPVGMPLNSKPAPPQPKMTITPSATPGKATIVPVPTAANGAPAILQDPNAAPAPAAVATAPGMNPPHGQPGHRCDIAVGQSLPKE
jgi:hypothetical protein